MMMFLREFSHNLLRSWPTSWLATIAYALVGLTVMLAYSPLADRLATKLVQAPPKLGAFRALQQSKMKLVAGIVIAWVLGGFLEEVVFRVLVLQSVRGLASAWFSTPVSVAIGVCVAALGAGVVHLYQGLRAAVIITQLSILFGVLFVVSGYDLWTVVLCHGLYDTIAFIRFASGNSRYSTLEDGSQSAGDRQA